MKSQPQTSRKGEAQTIPLPELPGITNAPEFIEACLAWASASPTKK